MTDRELLEAAAKAIGWRWSIADLVWYDDQAGTWTKDWNPLVDDGDALRLAVKLGIACSVRRGNACATYEGPHGFFVPMDEPVRDDPCAAARRAIVRAAAAMTQSE
jgi:hypothetical protein